jgi:hypothetical protein
MAFSVRVELARINELSQIQFAASSDWHSELGQSARRDRCSVLASLFLSDKRRQSVLEAIDHLERRRSLRPMGKPLCCFEQDQQQLRQFRQFTEVRFRNAMSAHVCALLYL